MQAPDYKNLVATSAIILIALIVSVNIYNKQNKELNALKTQKQTEEKKNILFADIAKLEKTVQAYKKLYPQKDSAQIISYLNNLAQELGVEIVSLKPANQADAGEYIAQPFVLSVRADGYHKIGRFISRLESSSDIYTVDSLEIRPQTALGEKIEANFTVSVLFFKD